MNILGIDPGFRNTGWAVVKLNGNSPILVGKGVISPCVKEDTHLRLAVLYKELSAIIKEYSPFSVAIEETFVNKNPTSTMLLSQARGVLLSCVGAFDLNLQEYPANTIKKQIVGKGHASKEQVLYMVKVLFPKVEIKKQDEADAIAIALCHCYKNNLKGGL